MGDTKIEMKIEEEIKPLKELCEKMVKKVSAEVEKGLENIETHELYEVADIIKDLAEAKKFTVEACYKTYILGAMEKHEDEYGDTWDEEGAFDEKGRRYYNGQPRSKSSGRFMSRNDGRRNNEGRYSYDEPMYHMTPDMYREHDARYYRDVDRDNGRMYYSDNGMSANGGSNMSGGNMGRNSYTSRYENAKRGYEESKMMHKDNTPESKQAKMKDLEMYMKELSEDVTGLIMDATPEEKTMLKNKMQVLMQKIQ